MFKIGDQSAMDDSNNQSIEENQSSTNKKSHLKSNHDINPDHLIDAEVIQSLDAQPIDNKKIPDIISILPLIDVVLFPKMVIPLVVMQKDSIQLIDDAMKGDKTIGFVVAKNKEIQTKYELNDLYQIGCTATILKIAKSDENTTQILVQGGNRFSIKELVSNDPYMKIKIEPHFDISEVTLEIQAYMSNMVNVFGKIIELSTLPKDFAAMAQSISEPGTLVDMIISIINCTVDEKQKILESILIKDRLEKGTEIIHHHLEIVKLGNKIQTQVKGDLDKNQRDYYLRQQLKTIKNELGETEEKNVELEEYRKKINECGLTEEAKKEAERELNRLEQMHPSSSEYTVALTYLDWITALPWNKSSEDNLDLKKAKQVLDEDHFGLDKAKKRIIEYLAVKKLKPDSKGPILCFVGPPGTGKTSMGRSIARALGRKFHRVSLGGVRDEAEIRGHRRTYVGALPGRIIQGIRRTDKNNPVFMLDEIDKIGTDFRGDPSSALLEVLDPEQNYSFSDHYLDIAFDLSRVMFITTANILDPIPAALKDRMEVLKLSGYTDEEKLMIANRYLIPRQRKEHGLTHKQIQFTNGAIKYMISKYTREAGLRNLEREIASVCRGVASKIVQDELKTARIRINDLHDYLGAIKYTEEIATRTSIPGVAIGMAWTQAGGEILFVEATYMPGKGKLALTGQLGDVMKESANTALTFVRSHSALWGISSEFFEKNDIHIHIPAGAIPKDGPSAGITILTALASLLTNTKLKLYLAMTGEITLRGLVLAVGGIKEKVLSAHRSGIKTIILPKDNKKDMEDIPDKIKKGIQFHFTDKMEEVLKLALEDFNNNTTRQKKLLNNTTENNTHTDKETHTTKNNDNHTNTIDKTNNNLINNNNNNLNAIKDKTEP